MVMEMMAHPIMGVDGDGGGDGDGDGDGMNVWMLALMVVLETRIESGNVMIINCSSLIIVVVGYVIEDDDDNDHD